MQQPKRFKYRKVQRGSRRGKANSGNVVSFGDFGLQALESAWVTAAQIEAARRAITRYIRRGGKVWIRVFPDKPVPKKPAETRQGSGKGAPDHWVAVIKSGKMMFEMAGVRNLSTADLKKQLEEAHQELFNLRFRLTTKQLVNHRELRRVRKNIARYNTLIAERELGIR